MKNIRVVILPTMVLLCSLLSQAQQSVATAANSTVPPLIQFSNVATDEGGNSLSGVVCITFSLYSSQQGGEPLWAETQNSVPLDGTGHYSVQLGITKPAGVPTTLFTTGEARWLGVKIAEQVEQPRVLLLSVPYALKAGDAATIGGLPPSAFVLAAPTNSAASMAINESSTGQNAPPPAGTITGTGTVNFLPLWDSTSDIISSVLFQSGTGSTAKVGINTTTPASTLDVKGSGTIRGTLSLPATGTATATAGRNSQPLNLAASAFSSSTSKAANQTFQWQAEPAGNDTSSPSGTLNLLFGEGTAKPSETGLNIASNGQITFAQGQIFPGTGDGTVTSVAGGAGLAGGTITGSGTLSIATGGVANAMLANSSLTLTAGTDLTGGGSVALGGTTTLNLDTTKVPQLNAANTFTGNQTVNGTITATSSLPNTLVGNTSSGSGAGVLGNATATTGLAAGVYGSSSSAGGFGVEGSSSNGVGVEGTSGNGSGVVGLSQTGVAGLFSLSTATGTLIQGQTVGVTEFTVDHGGNVTASGSVTGGVVNASTAFDLGGTPFAFGSYGNDNAFLGFAGNATMTGINDTVVGVSAFTRNTTGSANTASGANALFYNTTGSYNTAIGSIAFTGALGYNATGSYNTAVGTDALGTNTTGHANTGIGNSAGVTADGSHLTGSNNTALGTGALIGTGTLTNATAIGANAQVNESNAMVLGSINGLNFATASTNVGIGTSSPLAALDVAGNGLDTYIGNPGCASSGFAGIAFGNSGFASGCTNSALVGDNIGNTYVGTGSNTGSIVFRINSNATTAMKITDGGLVGIGTTSPDSILSVNGSADKPGGGSWGTFSDGRLKNLNGNFNSGLSQVLKLHPVRYRYKPDNAMGIRDTDEHIGVVAQEVQRVIPEAVTENNKGYLLVNNDPIIWTMLNAIKEQQQQIKQQRSLLRAQNAAMRSLQAEVRETRETLRKVKAQVAASQPAFVAAK